METIDASFFFQASLLLFKRLVSYLPLVMMSYDPGQGVPMLCIS